MLGRGGQSPYNVPQQLHRLVSAGRLKRGFFRRRRTQMHFALGVIVGLCLANDPAPVAPSVQGLQIFHRDGDLDSQALGIDGKGNVFGLRDVKDETGSSEKAFWRGVKGSEEMIPALPGYNYSYPYAIAAKSGLVVGRAGRVVNKNGSMQAFAWNPATGSIEGLGFIGADVSSAGWGVSADGNTVSGVSVGREKGLRQCV